MSHVTSFRDGANNRDIRGVTSARLHQRGRVPHLGFAAGRVPRGPLAARVILMEMTRAMVLPTRASDDEAAFEHFFLDSCQLVVGMVTVTTGDVAAAEDAVQEAYLRAHQRWSRVAGLERPDLWVVRVATRIAVSSWRRRRHETQLNRELEAEVADSIARIWTRWGLEGLSPQQRLAVVLHHVHGLPVADVAAAAGSSTETVRTHLKRARQRLRTRLADEESNE
jgi:RNA polymerase sigma-70 factor (ECF subfamily)